MLVRVKAVVGGGLVPLMVGEDHVPENTVIVILCTRAKMSITVHSPVHWQAYSIAKLILYYLILLT